MYLDPHLSHRKAQEASHFVSGSSDPMQSLVTVELNITELCNRTCAFCPRSDPKLYPNRNLNMTLETAEKIAAEIASENLHCRISFSGFGESTLHRQFPQMVRLFREILPHNAIELNTNGDRLTPEGIRLLFEAGLSYLYINMYDGPEQETPFKAMLWDAGIDKNRVRLRPHWEGLVDNGLTLNNRGGTLFEANTLAHKCHYPFYKMIIDWNGDVLFCSNDWRRIIVVGNIMEKSIREIWLSEEMRRVRDRLARGDRSESPCNTCNVNGTLSGEPSFNLLMDHYASS